MSWGTTSNYRCPYTRQKKGLAVGAEHNVLDELEGSPGKTPWAPAAKVFDDMPHVARASGQLTIAAAAAHSIVDVAKQAQAETNGTVFSIQPAMHGKHLVYHVSNAENGKVVERNYDVAAGKRHPVN